MMNYGRQHAVDNMVESRQETACSIKSKQQKVDSKQGKIRKNLPTTYCLLSTKSGFTLVELLITMAVFVLVIAGASQVFTGLLTQFKQQSKITETNIEGIVGLEILRQDIEHAGYGLPWIIPSGTTYQEAASSPANTYNDSTTTGDPPTSSPPRPILSGNNMSYSSPNDIFNGSDYLVIKSVNIARNSASQKWTRLGMGDSKRNGLSGENFVNTDRVTVISPGSTSTNNMSLIVSGGIFFTTYNNTSAFAPSDTTDTRIIYGVDPDTNLRMPFNRADYYIWRGSADPATDDVPDRCATNTGLLRKTVVNHGAGTFQGGILPLLDCVADIQVIYRLDTNADGVIDTTTDNISTLTAQQIRDRLKEVRVYVLSHEGQRDVNYRYPNTAITVGEFGVGRNFNLTTITNYQNYRWKIYTIVVKPKNLSGE